MKKKNNYYVLFLCLFMAGGLSVQGAKLLKQQVYTVHDFVAEELVDPNMAIFYGRVIDEDQKPVPGATILLSQTDRHKNQTTLKISTNKNGEFGIYKSLVDLQIISIFKTGYAFNRKLSSGLHYSWAEDPNSQSLHISTCYNLKKSQGSELVQDMYSMAFIPQRPIEYRADLETEGGFRLGSNENQSEQTDLIIKGEYIKERGVYRLDLKMINKEGGILVADGPFAIAPESGYETSLSILLGAEDKIRHVYVVGPDRCYYSHLLMTIQRFPQSLMIQLTIMTNKTGFGYFDFQPITEEKLRHNQKKTTE